MPRKYPPEFRRQVVELGHANLGITSIYLQGIDSSEIISTVHGRPSPTISTTAGLHLKR
jgi:integrase/recombinase XerD